MLRRVLIDLVCLGIGSFLVGGAANLVMDEVGPTAQAQIYYYCANKTPCPTTSITGCTCVTALFVGNCQPFQWFSWCVIDNFRCNGLTALGVRCSCESGCG